MPRYTADLTAHPSSLEDLIEYVKREHIRIQDALAQASPVNVQLEELHTTQKDPENGTLLYADGTDWDPGEGSGIYARLGGAFKRLQDSAPVKDYEFIEEIDLTNGEADDLTEIDFVHTLEAGYVYRVVSRSVAADATTYYGLRMRNDAGSWLTGSSDYQYAYKNLANSGLVNQTGTLAYLIGYSGSGSGWGTPWEYTHDIHIFGAMDTSRRTMGYSDGVMRSSTGMERNFASFALDAIDGHDKIRLLLTGSANFTSGVAFLYRFKES